MKKKDYKKKIEKEKQDLKDFKEKNQGINIKTFIYITIGVIGFFALMLVFTKIKTGEWNIFTKENGIKYSAEVQNIKILCGSVLNREDKEYYVLAYNMQEDSASLYETVVEKYKEGKDTLPLYKLDLANSRNNICKGDSLNITNDVTTLKLSIPTLIKVKDGKIIENYTNYDSIKNHLFSYVD